MLALIASENTYSTLLRITAYGHTSCEIKIMPGTGDISALSTPKGFLDQRRSRGPDEKTLWLCHRDRMTVLNPVASGGKTVLTFALAGLAVLSLIHPPKSRPQRLWRTF